MPELHVGIIGCGRMGRERARCATASGARVSHVLDVDLGRSAPLAHEHGAQAVEDVAALGQCDAVFLCTPPDMRPVHARWAAGAGVPFFAEKPIAIDIMEAERVAVMLEARPVVNAVGYMNRSRTSVRYARRLLDSRRILGLTAYWVSRPYSVPWWLSADRSGGPFNEQATHLVDLARFLCGEIARVHPVVASSSDGAMASSVATTLVFSSGAVGTLLYSCEASAKDIGLRIVTPDGSIAFSSWDFSLSDNTIEETPSMPLDEDVFLIETSAFLDAVRSGDGSGVLSEWRDASRTQQVVHRVRQELDR